MQITVAERRAIMNTSMLEPDFRELLQRDPRAALKDVTGKQASSNVDVIVVEETEAAWEFVIPTEGSIEAELPMPTDARAVVENDVYALLRADPSLRSKIESDPKGFLVERFGMDLGETGVNVRTERAGQFMLVLPYAQGREELPDEMLDLVAGGGDAGCQNGNNNSQRTTPRPWK